MHTAFSTIENDCMKKRCDAMYGKMNNADNNRR